MITWYLNSPQRLSSHNHLSGKLDKFKTCQTTDISSIPNVLTIGLQSISLIWPYFHTVIKLLNLSPQYLALKKLIKTKIINKNVPCPLAFPALVSKYFAFDKMLLQGGFSR